MDQSALSQELTRAMKEGRQLLSAMRLEIEANHAAIAQSRVAIAQSREFLLWRPAADPD